MCPLLQFVILSVPIVYFSRRNLLNPKSHGFFRFFGWEILLWIFIANRPFWFIDPFSTNQITSWMLLIVSVYLVIAGGLDLLRKGKASSERTDPHLFGFEKTTELVDTGIYRLVRHPLYASLIYLSWGILLKNITIPLLLLTIVASILFYLTAKHDEKECIEYFGDKYLDYIKRSKMFIPFVF